jgi:hypothetical protein
MRKYETIEKLKKEYQQLYEDYYVDLWQGGNDLEISVCDIIDNDIVYFIFEFEFKYKWNLKNVKHLMR